jgi:lipopolysaccharide transport system ATP-binding protein
MSNTFRLDVDRLSKKFSTNLKSSLRYGLTDSFRRVLHLKQSENLRNGEFWALDNVSFSLEEGKSLGLMGLNGSGKTTLLRILNGTYKPDKGYVKLRGSIGSLIAAGAGFSPLLTGRENIYVNGTLLGMKPKEIEAKFEEIVEFSDLGKFIDMPVKNYSSGMSVRLGFAVATISSPRILLVDEVLAVGDLNFQKKCFERINELKANGTSVILVSHSVGAIWSVCDSALVLEQGQSRGVMDVESGCKLYEVINNRSGSDDQYLNNEISSENYGSNFESVFVENHNSLHAGLVEISRGQRLDLIVNFNSEQEYETGILRLQVDSQMHKVLAIVDSYEAEHQYLHVKKGANYFKASLSTSSLRPGRYSISLAFLKAENNLHVSVQQNAFNFVVQQNEGDFLYADPRASVFIETEFTNVR